MNTAAQSAGVLGFEEAYEVVRERCHKIVAAAERMSEEVLLMQALGRVLLPPQLPQFIDVTPESLQIEHCLILISFIQN